MTEPARVVTLFDPDRRKKCAIAFEIFRALNALGGAAHLQTLIDVVAAHRRQTGKRTDAVMEQEIAETLLEYEAMGDGENSPLFWRPFGSQSQRWAVRFDAQQIRSRSSGVSEDVNAILADVGVDHDYPGGIEIARRQINAILSSSQRRSPKGARVIDEPDRFGAQRSAGAKSR